MLRNIDCEDEENRRQIWRTTDVEQCGNIASNQSMFRPTSQRRGVTPAALFSAAPTAADDDDFLYFWHEDILFIKIFVL